MGRQTLARYFASGQNDPSGAREIINGKEYVTIGGVRTLLADVIAKYHNAFLAALAAQPARVGAGFGGDFSAQGSPMPIGAIAEAPFMQPLSPYASEEPYSSDTSSPDLVELTATIVTGFVSKNEISVAGVDELIETVHGALSRISSRGPSEQYSVEKAADDAEATLAAGQDNAPPFTAPRPASTRRSSNKRSVG
jgi:hypothetical protein